MNDRYYGGNYRRNYDNRGYNNRRYNNYRDPRGDNQRMKPQPQPKKIVPDFTGDEWKNKLKTPAKDSREQTEDVTATKGSDFESFISNRALLAGIFEMGFEKPSPVQEECIPLILMRNSVLARAKNGTGKTGAFAIPTLNLCDANLKATQLLVLLPTRELALQTANVLKKLAVYLNLEIVTSTGGTNLKDDIIRLQEEANATRRDTASMVNVIDIANVVELEPKQAYKPPDGWTTLTGRCGRDQTTLVYNELWRKP